MADKTPFRQALEAAVLERHCANHPMTEKWAKGELGRNACMGWAVEHWHWISNMVEEVAADIIAKAPPDVVEMEKENLHEETDPEHSHLDIVLRFAEANGADLEAVKAGRGLPTTRSWVDWLKLVARDQPWHCAIAAIRRSIAAIPSFSARSFSNLLMADSVKVSIFTRARNATFSASRR